MISLGVVGLELTLLDNASVLFLDIVLRLGSRALDLEAGLAALGVAILSVVSGTLPRSRSTFIRLEFSVSLISIFEYGFLLAS